ncbi:MAG: aminotransferase class I/II-fold pyridoxal phosphate-dependent enzyme, partial [Cyanobium sp.]
MLSNSYCIGLPGNRIYGGCDYIDMIEREVVQLATDLFGTKRGVVQFLSGMQATIGAYNAILEPGDTIVTALAKHGGHYSHNAAGPLRFFSPRILPVPFDESRYNIDCDRLDALLAAERPKLLVVGWSEFLFPHPLREIRELCDRHGTHLMYDMSHVVGLLAGGGFQPEAGELADIVTSSTGKSLHAPDHGLCLFND